MLAGPGGLNPRDGQCLAVAAKLKVDRDVQGTYTVCSIVEEIVVVVVVVVVSAQSKPDFAGQPGCTFLSMSVLFFMNLIPNTHKSSIPGLSQKMLIWPVLY